MLVDGYVAGTWRQRRKKDHVVVEVQPFEPLTGETLPELEDEAADVGRFLSADTKLQVAEHG